LSYLEQYLASLSAEEDRNKHLICWVSYFLVSNRLKAKISTSPKLKDPITRSVFNNRGAVFKSAKEFSLFEGSVSIGKKVTMLEHLDVFNPPQFA
jgi:hypothetical protein